MGHVKMATQQLYKVKKVKATKSKSASKKVKKPVASKKAKGTPSKNKAKTSKSSKPAKKAVYKSVSKSAKSKFVKKAAKPTQSAKANAPVKKKTAKPVAKKIAKTISVVKAKKADPKKITKPAPAKASKAVKVQLVKPAKAEKPTKVAKPVDQPPKTTQKEKKQEKISAKDKKIGDDDFGFDDGFDEKPVKKKGKGGRKPKSKNDDDEPEIAHDELIEQIIQTTKKQSKAPKKPRIIQTFVNPMAALSIAAEGAKKTPAPKKEPKGKFELEYVVRTSAGILYELLTTPSGLSEWFADDVNIRDGIFTFFWDGSEQKAKLIGFKEEKYVRLQWLDKPEGTYFEFRIERDELTGDISLMIVDFAEEGSDQLTSKLLWDSQVNKLLNVLGSN
jgi:uncharacterized protein YndB with AHSA1/START domain